MTTPFSQMLGARMNLSSSAFNRTQKPTDLPGGGANSVYSRLGPDGFWDQQGKKRGPLEPLERDNSKKQVLERNLLTNQMQHVQYINMTTIVVPPRLPNAESSVHVWLDLKKIIHAGDVVFSLRCPNSMIASQFATKMTRKSQFNYCYNINLATLNYIIFRFQMFFYAFSEQCHDAIFSNKDDFKASLKERLEAVKSLCEARYEMWKQWFDFIADAPASTTSKRLDQMLAWAYTDSDTQNFPCFFELWWNECEKIQTQLGDTYKREIASDLKLKEQFKEKVITLFQAKVDEIVWDFVINNTQTLGIYIGSDEAGGAHLESKNSNAVWPNDFAGVVQLTGKSRRTSNIWNRHSSGEERQGISSGDPLGFTLQKYEVVTKDGEDRSCEFKLSSNPNTEITVTPQQVNDFFKFTRSFSLLVPDSNVNHCYALSETPHTFWKFAHANQMCRNVNAQYTSSSLARDALACGAAPPMEIIMRRSFSDFRKYTVKNALDEVRLFAVDKYKAPKPPKTDTGGGKGPSEYEYAPGPAAATEDSSVAPGYTIVPSKVRVTKKPKTPAATDASDS